MSQVETLYSRIYEGYPWQTSASDCFYVITPDPELSELNGSHTMRFSHVDRIGLIDCDDLDRLRAKLARIMNKREGDILAIYPESYFVRIQKLGELRSIVANGFSSSQYDTAVLGVEALLRAEALVQACHQTVHDFECIDFRHVAGMGEVTLLAA